MRNLNVDIDDDLFVEIDKRTTLDFDHSDVVRKLLQKALLLSPPPAPSRSTGNASIIPSTKDNSVSFVQTPEYRVLSGINKYLAVLGWLHKYRPHEFGRIESYRRGNRTYFGKSQRQVEDSGENITAKQIPGSTVWALATLDHRTKRQLLADVLQLCDLQAGEIATIVDTIPDSGRHRTLREKTLEDYA